MVWLLFLASSVVVVLAATKLAEYADIISVRTKLGGLVVGTILLCQERLRTPGHSPRVSQRLQALIRIQ